MKAFIRHARTSFVCAVIATTVSTCCAHFLWVKTVTVEGQPQALLLFGESPADEAYHFPEKLAKAKLWSRATDGKQTEVAIKVIDTEDRVGLIGPIGDDKAPVLQTSQQYGIYGTELLVYHAKHVRGTTPDEVNAAGTSKELTARNRAPRERRRRRAEGVVGWQAARAARSSRSWWATRSRWKKRREMMAA